MKNDSIYDREYKNDGINGKWIMKYYNWGKDNKNIIVVKSFKKTSKLKKIYGKIVRKLRS